MGVTAKTPEPAVISARVFKVSFLLRVDEL